MTDNTIIDAFDTERERLARLTKKGIGMPAAGLLFWLGVAVLLRIRTQQSALVLSFFLTGAVFPIGAGFTRLLGGDVFAKSRTLTPLGLLLAAVQLFYWPVIIIVFMRAPEWVPLAMAMLFGSHFLPYAWLYRSRAYAFLAVSVVVVLSVAALVSRSPLVLSAPLLTASCYAVAIGLLWREVAVLETSPRATD
jgi:formate/nitrite transporter FocA (FNT family)